MLDAIGGGLLNIINPVTFFWLFLGVAVGLIVGILPGIGGSATLAILLPVVYGLNPTIALVFLIAIHAACSQGGVVTSILFGVPGESTTTATMLDGYPMTQQGKAGQALGASLVASMMGALFGGVVLAILIPMAKPIILAFGSPEIFMMAFMGISFVAVLGRGSSMKAFIAGGLGIMVSFVGFHSGTGMLRYTWDIIYLWKGLDVVPIFMGLFAIPEVIDLAVKGGAIAQVEETKFGRSDVAEGIKKVFHHWGLLLRCSAIGTVLGLIPGVGGVVSQFICYGHAKQTSKHAQEFGSGCIEGVIAPEAGNNAKEGGSLFAGLAFGLPSGAAMVIIIAALMVLGIKPGPEMITQHLDLFWTLVIALILGNIIASLICLLSARALAKISFIKGTILVPFIILLVILGSYGVANDVRDVLLAFLFGVIGYLMKTYDYSRVTFTIGFVLGDYAERYFMLSFSSLGPTFLLGSPIALVMFISIVLSVVVRSVKSLFKRILQNKLNENEE